MFYQKQLELGIKGNSKGRAARRQRRLPRSQWWFQEMRRVVDQTPDWPEEGGATQLNLDRSQGRP